MEPSAAGGSVIALMLLAATACDLFSRRIPWLGRARRVPGWLTWGGILAGIAVAASHGSMLTSLAGTALGFAVLAPFVLKGLWGEADALLLAAVGAWTGWQFVLAAAWWTAIAGALIALIYALRCPKGKDWRRRVYPYVPAITIGTAVAAFIR